MPRPVRVQVEGAVSYVTSRATGNLALFRDQKDFETYRTILLEYKAQFGFKLFAAVLLPGELHLAIEPSPAASLSTIMHAITSRYTKHYGKRYGHSGHLFQSRFKLTLMEKAPSLLRLTGYLHTLPRRCGASDDVETYRWSSIACYLAADTSRPGWCSASEVAEVLDQLRQRHPEWTYAMYLESVPEDAWEQCARDVQRSVVGSEAFQAAVEQKRKEAAKPAEAQAAADPVFADAAPAPVRPSIAWTAAAAIGVAMIASMFLALRTIDSLKQTVGVLSNENQHTVAVLLDQLSKSTGLRLASFGRPRSLNGTSWDIQLKPAFGASAEAVTDTLAFNPEASRVSSGLLSQAGFADAPVTVKRQGGTTVWETFQVGPSGETVSWRGEWKGAMMHGVMARQTPGSPEATFRFIGIPRNASREI